MGIWVSLWFSCFVLNKLTCKFHHKRQHVLGSFSPIVTVSQSLHYQTSSKFSELSNCSTILSWFKWMQKLREKIKLWIWTSFFLMLYPFMIGTSIISFSITHIYELPGLVNNHSILKFGTFNLINYKIFKIALVAIV